MFFTKTILNESIFQIKSVFHKDNFERIYISNKHYKSYVWSKKKKKKKKYFLVTLAENPGRAVYGGQWICGFTHFVTKINGFIHTCMQFLLNQRIALSFTFFFFME